MNNEKLSKKEIKETFEDIQFCLQKLENHAKACKKPQDVGFNCIALGLTHNSFGFSDSTSKFFNFCVGDSMGLISMLCTIIELLDSQGVQKEIILDFINNNINPNEHFDM